jgi:hypothetical protein
MAMFFRSDAKGAIASQKYLLSVSYDAQSEIKLFNAPKIETAERVTDFRR